MSRPLLFAVLGLAAVLAARVAVADAVELSGLEALWWLQLRDDPGSAPLGALIPPALAALGAPSALALRLPGLIAGVAAVAVATRAGAPTRVLIGLLGLPALALTGLLAGPAPFLTLAWMAALVAAQRRRWAAFAAAAVLGTLLHPMALLTVVLVPLAHPADLREPAARRALGGAAALGVPAAVALGGDAWGPSPAHALWEGAALPPQLLWMVGPLLLPTLVAALLFLPRAGRGPRLCWWFAIPQIFVSIGLLGDPHLAAPGLAAGVVGLAQLGGRWGRALSVGAGVNLLLTAAVLLHLVSPLANGPVDPRDWLSGGETLSDSIAAWGLEPVYAALPEDAALIAFHTGLQAGPLEGAPQTPALYVRPWAGSASVPTDADDLPRSGPNVVTAAVSTPDPVGARVVARWQVYRLGERP